MIGVVGILSFGSPLVTGRCTSRVTLTDITHTLTMTSNSCRRLGAWASGPRGSGLGGLGARVSGPRGRRLGARASGPRGRRLGARVSGPHSRRLGARASGPHGRRLGARASGPHGAVRG